MWTPLSALPSPWILSNESTPRCLLAPNQEFPHTSDRDQEDVFPGHVHKCRLDGLHETSGVSMAITGKHFSLALARDSILPRSPDQSAYVGVGCQKLSDCSSWTPPCCRRIRIALLLHSQLFVSFHLHAGRRLSLAAPKALWLHSNLRFTQSLR